MVPRLPLARLGLAQDHDAIAGLQGVEVCRLPV
jgi:hypothetical protein